MYTPIRSTPGTEASALWQNSLTAWLEQPQSFAEQISHESDSSSASNSQRLGPVASTAAYAAPSEVLSMLTSHRLKS